MSVPKRGEIWIADLGFAAKVRPVLVISVPLNEQDYALVQVVPHTTQNRGARFQVEVTLPFLEAGTFNVQGMLAVPSVKFVRCLGNISSAQMAQIEAVMKRWLGLGI